MTEKPHDIWIRVTGKGAEENLHMIFNTLQNSRRHMSVRNFPDQGGHAVSVRTTQMTPLVLATLSANFDAADYSITQVKQTNGKLRKETNAYVKNADVIVLANRTSSGR